MEFHGLLTGFSRDCEQKLEAEYLNIELLEIYGYCLGIKYKYDIRLMALIYFMVCLSIGNCIGLNLQ